MTRTPKDEPMKSPATPYSPKTLAEELAAFEALQQLTDKALESSLFLEELEKALSQSLKDDPPKKQVPRSKRKG